MTTDPRPPLYLTNTEVPNQNDPGIFIYPEICPHDTVTGWNAFIRGAYAGDTTEISIPIYGPTSECVRDRIAGYMAIGQFRIFGVPPEQRPPHVRIFSPDGGWLGACCAQGTGR